LSEIELLPGASDAALAIDSFQHHKQIQVNLAQMHDAYITGFIGFI
jgi:hypothetical protein